MDKKHGFWYQMTRVQIPALPLISYVTLGKLLSNCSALQFPMKIICTSQDCCEINEIINVKLLEQ